MSEMEGVNGHGVERSCQASFSLQNPFDHRGNWAGQSLSEHMETCIHAPYRKLDR